MDFLICLNYLTMLNPTAQVSRINPLCHHNAENNGMLTGGDVGTITNGDAGTLANADAGTLANDGAPRLSRTNQTRNLFF